MEGKKMDELLSWLRLQKGGVGTFRSFQQKSLALAASKPEHAALWRLLGDLSGRFADAYDGHPLPVDVARHALTRLLAFVEKAVDAESAGPAEYLALLNEVGLAELA
jgi:hypothetical protein